MTHISRKVTRAGFAFICASFAGNAIIMAATPVPIIRGADVLDAKAPVTITRNNSYEGESCLFRASWEKAGLGYPKPEQIVAKLESGIWYVTITNDRSYSRYQTPDTKVTVEDRRVVDCVNNKRNHRPWRIGMLALGVFGSLMAIGGSVAANNARNNRKPAYARYPKWS